MDKEELKSKLLQVEQQARLTLEEFPRSLTKERQRMIIALVRHIRVELDKTSTVGQFDLDPERTIEDFRH